MWVSFAAFYIKPTNLSSKPKITETHKKAYFLISKKADFVLTGFENLLLCSTLYFNLKKKKKCL